MKIYSKSDCSFEDGYIVKDDEIVCVDPNVVSFLNKLETALQVKKHIMAQPKPVGLPTMKGFKRESMKHTYAVEKEETPLLDAKIEEALNIMKEIDKDNDADELNECLGNISEELSWLDKDRIITNSEWDLCQFDTPHLGNPLALDSDSIIQVIKMYELYKECEVTCD